MVTSLKAHRPRQPSIEWLRSPWAILISSLLGAFIGTQQPQVAAWIAPFGTLYLGLLKMCVLPILLSAITNSLGRLMQSHDARQYVQRILVVFPLSLLGVSAIAVAIAAIAGPGRNLTADTLQTLGVLVNQSGVDLEMALSGPLPAASTIGVTTLVDSVVPDNIFAALSEDQTLKVLMFAMIFGVSLGLVKAPTTAALFDTLDSLYRSFNQVIHWLTYLLPFGLCSLLADQLSQVGVEVLLSMVDFVVAAIATFALIYLICTLIIWRRSGVGLWPTVLALKDPTILSLATSSSLACLPAAITSLSENLKFNAQTTSLVTPLAITLCRFGSVIYFASATLFVMQLYQRDLGLASLGIVIVGSILAGMATSGVTGILTLTMLGLVLDPLKLPLEAVLVLFIAIDPLMDPFRTLGIVHTGMAATALVAEREG
ncbi:MAG: dicarboxylate/amino acid:cation symporter [Shackletoniella antarctica]|uniref:Dicarboxylate/amino acid:cation symporter n=1 Tax=Shackletoniella antarctica TaxID=268115 RepID=A0A2W4WEM0_9CYAN|nr:MAG: dicarboxylate/amino acid:cation symporter [Shackletoniella antarctica]